MGAPEYKAQDFIDAAKDSKGIISAIAKRVGCARKTVYAAMERWSTVNDAILDERESMKDFAEGALFKQIASGNTTALIFYLKTQARDRGYVERQQLEHIDWHDKAIADIKAGELTYDTLRTAFDDSLASELFKRAGVPVTHDPD